MTKRAAQVQTLGIHPVQRRLNDGRAASVSPLVTAREPEIHDGLQIIAGMAARPPSFGRQVIDLTASNSAPGTEPRVTAQSARQPDAIRSPAQRLLDRRCANFIELNPLRQYRPPLSDVWFGKVANAIATSIEVDAHDANGDLRSLLARLKHMGRTDKLYFATKQAVIAQLPEGLRIRLAAVEWQILRDKILRLGEEHENLSIHFRLARELLAARWSLPFVAEAIWSEVGPAHRFTHASSTHLALWAQGEWSILSGHEQERLRTIFAARPQDLRKIALDAAFFDAATIAALKKCRNLHSLELQQQHKTAFHDFAWIDELENLDSLKLDSSIALQSIPPLTRSRLKHLTLVLDSGAKPNLAFPLDSQDKLRALSLEEKLADEDITSLPQTLATLELRDCDCRHDLVLKRLPDLQALWLTGRVATLHFLAATLGKPECQLRELVIAKLPDLAHEQTKLLNALCGKRSLIRLALAKLNKKAAGGPLLALLNSRPAALSELSLSIGSNLALPKWTATLLEALKQNTQIRKLALHFTLPTRHQEQEAELIKLLKQFRKDSKFLLSFEYSVGDRATRRKFNWRY